MSEAVAARRKTGLFGRRKGKKLRAHHQDLMEHALPGLAVDVSARIDPIALFGPVRGAALWLEIGFGGGEHLVTLAQNVGAVIGCEPFVNGVAKLLAEIERHGLDNLRVYAGDAIAVIDALPQGALAGVYMLYPDPWPKRRHRKRRLFTGAFLRRLARAMAPGAELRFATDIDDYAGWALARIAQQSAFVWAPQSAADWLAPWPGWSSTRFEKRALKAGRRPVYFTFRRA